MTQTTITIGNKTAELTTTPTGWELTGPDTPLILINKEDITLTTSDSNRREGFLTLHGKQWPYCVAYSSSHVFIWVAGQTLTLPRPQSSKGKRSHSNTNETAFSSGKTTATMPGNIVSVNVSLGQSIQEGDVLVVMESMKMELSLSSAMEGTVTQINVTEGDKVAIGQLLIEVTPLEPKDSAS